MQGEWKILGTAIGVASLMGLAYKMGKEKRWLTLHEVVSSLFVSLMAGLLIAFFVYDRFVPKGNEMLFYAVVSLAGIGGHSVLELGYAVGMQWMQRLKERKGIPNGNDSKSS